VARIVLLDGEQNLMSYLEKATHAARKVDDAGSIGGDLQDELATLSQFEEFLSKPFALETAKAALLLLPDITEETRASAALGLAADYCEHAAETLEKVRQLALDSANCLAKEVPAKMATWRGELQSKAMLKANPTKTSLSGFSSLFGSKKAIANVDPSMSPSNEILISGTEEDLAQRGEVRLFL